MPQDADRSALVRRGFGLEYFTLAWNVIGILVLSVAAVDARSIALAGFGADSLIEIGASTVVIWELSDASAQRRIRALQLIGLAFACLAILFLVVSTLALTSGHHAEHSTLGIVWTAATAFVMYGLAAAKARTGRALDDPVLVHESRVTLIDGVLASSVVVSLCLSSIFGWWWADPLAGYVIAFYAVREARACINS